MKHIIVNNLDIAYDDVGTGGVVLLVHGWGSNMQTFADLAVQLSKKFRILRLDLPGFGGSQTPQDAWTLDNYATFLEAFLLKLSVDRLHGLVGHSLGGRIAIRAQATGHLLSDKLILLASHGIAAPYSPRNVFYRCLSKIGKLLLAPLPSSTRQQLKAKLYKQAGSTDFLDATPAMKQTFQNIIKQDLRADAAHVPTDTLLIYGDQDDMTPAKYGKIFADTIPHARLEIIPGAEHYVHLDAAAPVAKLMEAFL